MKKLYEKNELAFALMWVALYCVLQSVAEPLNRTIGTEYAASAAFCRRSFFSFLSVRTV